MVFFFSFERGMRFHYLASAEDHQNKELFLFTTRIIILADDFFTLGTKCYRAVLLGCFPSVVFFSLIDSRSPNTEKMNDVFPDSYKSFSSNMLIFILANFNKKNFFLL